MIKPLEYSLQLENRGALLSCLEELSNIGTEILSKSNDPHEWCNEVYHIGSSTVKVSHNLSSGAPPYYCDIAVYGKADEEFLRWVKNKREHLQDIRTS